MVNKRNLNKLEQSLEEYFEDILNARVSGDHARARELFGRLSEKQTLIFFEYVDATYFYEVDDGEMVSEMIDLKNYFL